MERHTASCRLGSHQRKYASSRRPMISPNVHNPDLAERGLTRSIAGASLPLTSTDDLDPLIDAIGDARYVLLGEASHGTSEFYAWRTELSKRLIAEKQF